MSDFINSSRNHFADATLSTDAVDARSVSRSVRRRGAFTLIELLVVITIIGMLMAMAFPALQSAIAATELVTCKARQKEIAAAIQIYAGSKKRLPGYTDWLYLRDANGGTQNKPPVPITWVVRLLDQLGKKDILESLEDGIEVTQFEKQFVCPSEKQRTELDELTYALNTGFTDGQATDDRAADSIANGVFHKQERKNSGLRNGNTLKLESIADGQTTTVMLSENLQTGSWGRNATLTEEALGLTWRAEEDPADQYRINLRREAFDQFYPRPSSNHPGVVVMTMCSGNVKTIKEKIDYGVYIRIMTPDGRHAIDPSSGNPHPRWTWDPPLDKL